MNPQFARLARVFEYPDENYARHCREAGLEDFAVQAESLGVTAMQELYTNTFDWNPNASLDLSWHLYGEQYARGEFLVAMREKLRSNGIDETCELPDHLTHVLALFARLEAEELERAAREYAAPAIAKLLASLEQSASPFAAPLRVVRQTLPVQAAIPVLKKELPVLQGGDIR